MKILWIVFVWPERTSSAAGFRTLDLIASLRDAGHEVQVSSPCATNGFRGKLDSVGIKTYRFEPNNSEFDFFLKAYSPELVVFDRFMIEEQFGWRVREHVPEAVRVLDTVDLQSLRRAREAKVKAGGDPLHLTNDDVQSEVAIREVAAIYRSDITLIVSPAERSLLVDSYGIPAELLELCSFLYPLPPVTPAFEARNNFVSIGNFNHPPNADSFRLLHSTVWPGIRAAFKARGLAAPELHIYGAYPTREFMRLSSCEDGFRVIGPAEEVISTLSNYRLNLAPLRFGAGIKGKVSDGWAAGTPCVATSIAAEGMSEGHNFGGVIENDWERFAAQACELFNSRSEWINAQRCGYKIIETLFDHSKNASKFVTMIGQQLASLPERRQRNFTGKLLWHQTMRSTEYFSRWIELKAMVKGRSLNKP